MKTKSGTQREYMSSLKLEYQLLSQSQLPSHQVEGQTQHQNQTSQQQVGEALRYDRIKSLDPYIKRHHQALPDNVSTLGSIPSKKWINHRSTCDVRGRKKYRTFSSNNSSEGSLSSTSGYLDGQSPLDDPMFAPPPSPPINMGIPDNTKDTPITSTLPSYSMVKHSGNILARISLKSIFLKKWRHIFWISYGDHNVLFFRSRTDFNEWATNPYLTDAERMNLVKLQIDLKNDVLQPGVRCYRATSVCKKAYGRWGLMHTFKLEQWMYYGPIIVGAFASSNRRESRSLLIILKEMIKREKNGLTDFLSDAGSIHYDDHQDGYSSSFSTRSAPV